MAFFQNKNPSDKIYPTKSGDQGTIYMWPSHSLESYLSHPSSVASAKAEPKSLGEVSNWRRFVAWAYIRLSGDVTRIINFLKRCCSHIYLGSFFHFFLCVFPISLEQSSYKSLELPTQPAATVANEKLKGSPTKRWEGSIPILSRVLSQKKQLDSPFFQRPSNLPTEQNAGCPCPTISWPYSRRQRYCWPWQDLAKGFQILCHSIIHRDTCRVYSHGSLTKQSWK